MDNECRKYFCELSQHKGIAADLLVAFAHVVEDSSMHLASSITE